MTTPKYLDLRDLAEFAGVTYATMRGYHGHAQQRRADPVENGPPLRGDLPAPDAYFGRTPVWRVSTARRWLSKRPGQGSGGGRPAHRP